MNLSHAFNRSRSHSNLLLIGLGLFLVVLPAGSAQEAPSFNDAEFEAINRREAEVNERGAAAVFDDVAQRLLQMFRDGDVEAFARDLSPTLEDWKGVEVHEKDPDGEPFLGPDWMEAWERNRKVLEGNAAAMLDVFRDAGMELPDLRLEIEEVVLPDMGGVAYPFMENE